MSSEKVGPMSSTNIAVWAADRLAMQDTVAQYCWGYDNGDFEMLAGSFTAEGTTSGKVSHSDAAWGPTVGSQAIAEMLSEIRRTQSDQRRHTTHTFRFENQTETSADLHCYVTIISTEAGETKTLTAGCYHASMVKESDGQWRMADLTALLDSAF